MDSERFVNDAKRRAGAAELEAQAVCRVAWQPEARAEHRPGHMLSRIGVVVLLLTAMVWPAAGQTAVAAHPAVASTLQPALAQVGQALGGVDPEHWRAPGSVKSAAEGDIEAIQRDLNGTLAGLLQQADAAPGSVPAEFRVYRNVDALYDTLLRVVETAELAAPASEADALETALDNLENARAQVGDTILSGAQVQQDELFRLRRAIQAAAAAQRAPIRTTVVDDYGAPAQPHVVRHRAVRHTTHKTPAKPATSSQKKPGSR
ncbi:MAG TPA: hypothetical protein VME18_03810 [Acidobacteriaceae bacterium]|nr:hypothetical protein [Acidobacteriaceae bacterium]